MRWASVSCRDGGRSTGPRPKRRRAPGFTLLELINALALTCVVAALGMYGTARWVRHSRTAEAIGSVQALAAAAADYYDKSDRDQPAGTKPEQGRAMRHFPPTSRASVPPSAEDVKGKRYQSNFADWSRSPWVELHFSMAQPQHYAYSFESQGRGREARATATAHGDLDADGNMSTFRLTVAPDDQFKAVVSPKLERENQED